LACGPCKACWHCIAWTTKCGPCIVSWHAAIATCCCLRECCLLLTSAIATVLTLTLWPYPFTCMLYWGSHILHRHPLLGPLLGILWLDLWAGLCVSFFTFLYAILIGGIHEFNKGYGKMVEKEQNQVLHAQMELSQSLLQKKGIMNMEWDHMRTITHGIFPRPMIFEEHQVLRALDSAYEKDFFGVEPFVNDPNLCVPGFKADKIAIVGRTLKHQARIPLIQMATFITLRFLVSYLTCPAQVSSEGVLGTLSNIVSKTITERKASLYVLHMENAAHSAEERAMGSWAWQQLVEYVWKVL